MNKSLASVVLASAALLSSCTENPPPDLGSARKISMPCNDSPMVRPLNTSTFKQQCEYSIIDGDIQKWYDGNHLAGGLKKNDDGTYSVFSPWHKSLAPRAKVELDDQMRFRNLVSERNGHMYREYSNGPREFYKVTGSKAEKQEGYLPFGVPLHRGSFSFPDNFPVDNYFVVSGDEYVNKKLVTRYGLLLPKESGIFGYSTEHRKLEVATGMIE